MKRSLAPLLKGLVSLALLGFLLWRIDLFHFLGALSAAKFPVIAVALLAYLVGQLVSSLRWLLLARALGFENRFKDFAIYYFIGMFFSLFAVSTVGGDVGRVFYLTREGENSKEGGGSTMLAAISVLADRAIGMAVLVWIGAVALALFPAYALPAPILYTTYALAAGLLLGCLALPLIGRVLPGKEHPVGRKLHLALQKYPSHWREILAAMLLSLLIHAVQSWMHVLLGSSLGIDIPWSYAFIIYPLVGTFSALPVSLNGIGLREGGYLFLLTRIGISPEKGIAFGLLWFMVVALDSLVGGLLFILRKKPATAAAIVQAEE